MLYFFENKEILELDGKTHFIDLYATFESDTGFGQGVLTIAANYVALNMETSVALPHGRLVTVKNTDETEDIYKLAQSYDLIHEVLDKLKAKLKYIKNSL